LTLFLGRGAFRFAAFDTAIGPLRATAIRVSSKDRAEVEQSTCRFHAIIFNIMGIVGAY
jgi:hypothetical protein